MFGFSTGYMSSSALISLATVNLWISYSCSSDEILKTWSSALHSQSEWNPILGAHEAIITQEAKRPNTHVNSHRLNQKYSLLSRQAFSSDTDWHAVTQRLLLDNIILPFSRRPAHTNMIISKSCGSWAKVSDAACQKWIPKKKILKQQWTLALFQVQIYYIIVISKPSFKVHMLLRKYTERGCVIWSFFLFQERFSSLFF